MLALYVAAGLVLAELLEKPLLYVCLFHYLPSDAVLALQLDAPEALDHFDCL